MGLPFFRRLKYSTVTGPAIGSVTEEIQIISADMQTHHAEVRGYPHPRANTNKMDAILR